MGECIYEGDGWGPCMEGTAEDGWRNTPGMEHIRGPLVGPPEGRLDIPVTPEAQCSLCVNRGVFNFEELPPIEHRIVIPALTDTCPAAQALRLEQLLPEVRIVDQDDFAYGRLLQEVWRDALEFGYGFTLVEHDVVPWPGALYALWGCTWGQGWCGYDYLLGTCNNLGGGLGCLHFRYEFIARHADLCERWHEQDWGGLDGRIYEQLRNRGIETYHEHWPGVGHCPSYATG